MEKIITQIEWLTMGVHPTIIKGPLNKALLVDPSGFNKEHRVIRCLFVHYSLNGYIKIFLYLTR